ncbi:hypothetical protein [Polyangium fumosum]|uniref:STAS/SEC14 domain-containing protein n=1 Tax=Polyangium fumosum TaxID=889272 RepID=A0A4U1JJJ0_9BACT|nr:hypothetical protein [Polyangium fumosum]TKD12672.1 hypothetical protein E8A74_02665 [Polyangium fumosum]
MAGPTPGQRRQFGEQVAWTEAPNLFGMRLSGKVDGPSLGELVAYQVSFSAGKDHIFVLCDLSAVTGATIEARRVLQETRHTTAITHVCFGAKFTTRIFAEMVVRAARILGSSQPDMQILFFSTEAEARAYIAHARPPRRARRP